MRKQKDNYLTHWKELTKKQSKLELYLALNREYTVAEYMSTVTDPNLKPVKDRQNTAPFGGIACP